MIALERDGMKVSKGAIRIKCQKLCNDRGNAISNLVDVIIEVRVRKPKGSFEILNESGCIDPSKPSKHIEKRRTDAMENLLKEQSLKKLLEKKGDCMAELTLFECHAQLLGAMVARTPKCYPGLRG